MRIIITILFFIFTAQNSLANKEYQPNDADLKYLNKIEKYLNEVKYFYADFIQQSEEGNAFGGLYISRPGKLKMHYSNPNNLDIIINGAVFLYHDKDLNERSYLQSNNFPISFLARNNISFTDKNDQILLKNTKFKDDNIVIFMSFITEQSSSDFKLAFKLNPISLKSIEVFDSNDKLIYIKIISPKYNEQIEDKFFKTTKDV